MEREAEKQAILNKQGPIIIIEDDNDEQEILSEVFYDLNYSGQPGQSDRLADTTALLL